MPKPAPYKLLAPSLPQLLTTVAFPLLCFSAADAELWSDDPHEYIRKGYDILEDMHSPRTAAMSFIAELLRVRGDEQMHSFLSFLSSVLHRCSAGTPPESRPYAQLDGALFALGSLCELLRKRQPYCGQLEGMLGAHVLPEFSNPRGHLRAKACWVAGMYADVDFASAQAFNSLLAAVVGRLADAELPVRVDAAVALRSFVESAVDLGALRSILPSLLDSLFQLMAEVESEDLVFTLEEVVEKFGDEMAPYAEGLIGNLVAAFWRLLAAEGEGDEEEGGTALSCLGCLRTMSTVLDAVSSQPALYPRLEAHLLPLLRRMISAEGQDVYEEVLDILSYLTYYSPTLSDDLWALFPVLIANVNDWGLDYFRESLTALDNMISRDTQRFLGGWDAAGTRHLDAVFRLCAAVLSHPEHEEEDCMCAPQLLAIVLQHCGGQVDSLLEPALALVASRLEGTRRAEESFFRDVLLLVWTHALQYNARLALAAATRSGALGVLFTSWNAALGKRRRGSGKRVHFRREQDKKICALALTQLLALPPAEAPAMLGAFGTQMLVVAVELLSELKTQRQARLKAEEEEDDGLESDDDSDDYAGVEDDEEAPGEAQPHAQGRAPAAAGDDDGASDGDSDWSDFTEEDDGAAGPLDAIDPFIFFTDAMSHLAATQQQRFALLTAPLQFPAQAAMAAVGAYAEVRRAEIAQERAAAVVPSTVGPPA